MIDGMEKVLKEEQADDDSTKSFCDKDLEKSGAEKKDTEEAIAASEAFVEETTAESAATAEDNAALQLIDKAKNRLFKFYRPTMYKEAPTKELTEEEKIFAASGRSDMIATAAPEYIAGTTQTVFAEVRSHSNDDAAPPPPPETWGAYQKKDGKSNGVMALMDMLLKELSGDLTASENEEKTSQKDYERLMSDSQATRAQNVASITDKESAKADMDT